MSRTTLVRRGWIVNGQSQEVCVHRKEATASDQGFIPCPGSRGELGDGQINGVYPFCDPSPVNDHHILQLLYSVAHSLPHGPGRLYPRNAYILRPRLT